MRLQHHHRTLQVLARELVADPEFVEDLVQETWVSIIERSIPSGPGFVAWARKTMRNKWIDRWRSDTAREDHERRSAQERSGRQSQPSWEGSVGEQLLSGAMEQLTTVQQQVLELRFVEELPARDAAERLGMSEDALRSQQKRSLEKLRRVLDDSHNGDRRAWGVVILSGVTALKQSSGAIPVAATLFVIALGTTAILMDSWEGRPSSRGEIPSGELSEVAVGVPLVPPLANGSNRDSLHIELESGRDKALALASNMPDSEASLVVVVRDDQGFAAQGAQIMGGLANRESQAEPLGSTGPDGRCELSSSGMRPWIWATKVGLPPSDAVFVGGPDSDRVALQLVNLMIPAQYGEAKGVVVDPNGRPVAGASVRMIAGGGEVFAHRMDGVLTRDALLPVQATGGDGEFDLGQVASMNWEDGSLLVDPPAGSRLTQMEFSLRSQDRTRQLELVLPEARSLRLDVRREAGGPIRGLAAWAGYPWGEAPLGLTTVGTVHTVEGLGGTAERLTVTDRNGDRGRAVITPEVIQSGLVEVVLRPKAKAVIRAVDRSGAPLMGWRVLVCTPPRIRQDPLLTYVKGAPPSVVHTTDRDGLVHLERPTRPGKWVYLFPPSGPMGAASASAQLAGAPEDELRLVAHANGDLPCSVTGTVAKNDRGGGAAFIAVRGRQIHHLMTASIDTESGRFTVEGLPPGRSILSLVSPGNLNDNFERLELAPGEFLDLGELLYERPVPLRLRISRNDGKPLVAPELYVSRKGQIVQSGQRWTERGLKVDPSGVVELPAIAGFSHHLHCSDDGGRWARILMVTRDMIESGLAQVELVPTRPISLECHLDPADAPSGMYFFTVSSDDGELWFHGESSVEADGDAHLSINVPVGRFRVTGVPYFKTTFASSFLVEDDAQRLVRVNLELE